MSKETIYAVREGSEYRLLMPTGGQSAKCHSLEHIHRTLSDLYKIKTYATRSPVRKRVPWNPESLLVRQIANAVYASIQNKDNIGHAVREDFEAGSRQGLMEFALKMRSVLYPEPGFDQEEFFVACGFEKEMKQGAFGFKPTKF